MQASFRLGRLAGIEIGVHYTWLFAFALITWSLAVGFFPDTFPGWSPITYWVTGAVAAILLFVSVLLHELAHSFVALSKGLSVAGITLFIFGGVSQLSGEATKAQDEFVIAVVGPLTSFLLGGVFWVALTVTSSGEGPVGAIFFYLAFINALLGVFNLLPGFPLDGGRVLRSILWGVTGSMTKATNIAALVGQGFGWLLIVFGVSQVLSGNFLGGLWIAFIGWFLNGAADSARKDVTVKEQFRGVPVRWIMEDNVETIDPSTTIDSLVRDLFLRKGRRAAPVVQDGRLAGIATLTDVKEVEPDKWTATPVSSIMTYSPLFSVSPTEDLNAALALLATHSLNQLLVMRDGRLMGMISRADIIRYLQFAEERGLKASRER